MGVRPTEGKFDAIIDGLYKQPILRRTMARIFGGVQWAFAFANQVFPNEYFAMGEYYAANAETFSDSVPKYGLIVEYDQNGKIVQSWHSPSGKYSSFSEAFLNESDGYLYLGSYVNPYVGRLKYTPPE